MELVERGIRPSQIMTRAAIDNAIASVAATGGSTNGVLHLLALAHELGIPLELEDFDRIAERTPIVAALMPGGRFTALDIHEAGGIGLVARELLEAGPGRRDHAQRRRANADRGRRCRRRDAAARRSSSRSSTRSRRPAASPSCAARWRRTAASSSLRATSAPLPRTGACLRLRGRLLRRGARAAHRCRATSSSSATRARSAAPACRRCSRSPPRWWARAWAARSPCITDGRFSGGTHGLMIGHVAPEAALGGPIALVAEGDEVVIDVDARRLDLVVDDGELAHGAADWVRAVAPVHRRRAGQVRRARLIGLGGRGHDRAAGWHGRSRDAVTTGTERARAGVDITASVPSMSQERGPSAADPTRAPGERRRARPAPRNRDSSARHPPWMAGWRTRED